MSHVDRLLAAGNLSLSDADRDLIVALVSGMGPCSLDEKPGANWVQKAGGLPNYICNIAQDIHEEGGKTISEAIAIAVSRVKKWAAGVGVSKEVQAKAAAAVAEWEKLRAKSHAHAALDKAANNVKATAALDRVLQYNQPRRSPLDCLLALAATDVTDSETGGDLEPAALGRTVVKPPNTPDPMLVMWADPGHQADGKPRYQLNSPAQVKAAWNMVNQKLNSRKYTPWQLAHIRANIEAAANKHGVDITALSHGQSALDRIVALATNGGNDPDAKDEGKEYANTAGDTYADPGYQSDGKKRYPVDSAEKVRAAWSYINQKDNAAKYDPDDLAKVKANIKRAAKKYGVDISDSGD